MKNKTLHTFLCATGISFCLGAGAIGSMVTGLDLPVKLTAVVLLCLLLSAVIAGCGCLRYGRWIILGLMGICLLNPVLWDQFKFLAAEVALRLRLAYAIPTPEFLQEKFPDQVLPALCYVAALIMVATDWSIQTRKTAIPAAVLSLLPLVCCVTVTDTVPGSPWLFLWGLGLVLLLMTQGVRHKSVIQANRLTALLLLPTVLVLLLLFRLIPRNAQDRWSIAEFSQQIFSYFDRLPGPETDSSISSSTVDLSNLDRQWQSRSPVMDVTADFTGTLYLRGRDYDEYTGTAWNSTEWRREILYGYDSLFHEQDGAVEISLRQSKDFYYLPAITQEPQWITDGLARNASEATSYRFDHCSMRSDWQDNWLGDPNISTTSPRYLALSDQAQECAFGFLSGRGPDFADLLYSNNTPAIAEQIALILRNHVPYDLSTEKMPAGEEDLAVWFLTEAESGYCVHYATAAVVLLRACNIPARYVEGYAINVQAGKTTTVRELNAHAWVEYYVARVGWMILEATPAGGIVEVESPETPPSQTQPATTPTTVPTTAPTQPGQIPIQEGKAPPLWLKISVRIFLWSLAAVLLLWTQYRLRRRMFRRALHRGKSNRRALVIYRRLCRLSKWAGKAVPTELTQLAQKARFSNHCLTPAELFQLQSHLKLEETNLSKLPIAKRLCAKWLFARY